VFGRAGLDSTAPADLTTVKAIGVDVVYDSEPLTGSGFQLGWGQRPRAPHPRWLDRLEQLRVSGQATDQTTFLLPAEPRKVGINRRWKWWRTLPADLNEDFTFTLTAVETRPQSPAATQTANK
jgi:hypothetical protein